MSSSRETEKQVVLSIARVATLAQSAAPSTRHPHRLILWDPVNGRGKKGRGRFFLPEENPFTLALPAFLSLSLSFSLEIYDHRRRCLDSPYSSRNLMRNRGCLPITRIRGPFLSRTTIIKAFNRVLLLQGSVIVRHLCISFFLFYCPSVFLLLFVSSRYSEILSFDLFQVF